MNYDGVGPKAKSKLYFLIFGALEGKSPQGFSRA